MTFLTIHHDHVFLEIMEFLKITIYKITIIIIEDEIEIVKENEEKKKRKKEEILYIYIYILLLQYIPMTKYLFEANIHIPISLQEIDNTLIVYKDK